MQFKIVACTLLILSIFSFVLAYPVPKREVLEACTDAAEGGENVISVSVKRRAPRGDSFGSDSDWSDSEHSDVESDSDTEWWTPSKSPPAPSGSHPGVDMPSSSSVGSESQVWSKPGGTEVPGAVKPGTTTENQPASSSQAKKVQWASTPEGPSSTPGKGKKVQWSPYTEYFMYEYEKDPLPLPPGRHGYLAKQAAQTLPKLQSQGFMGNVKSYFSKFLSKLRIWRRS